MQMTVEASPRLLRGNELRTAQWLITSPGSLLLSLLLLSAVFRPYAGIVHDARLYAVQVLDHVTPEVHSEDLYLKYGSQDKYSLFSLFAHPLADALGVPTAFFLLYLGGNACWLFALQKFVPTLLGQRLAALGALLYLAVNPLPFGGFQTFHVNENFLTPRVWAVALVVLGLERLLRERPAASLLWIVFSMVLHPIMGFSGLCIWSLWQLSRQLKPRAFALLTMAGVAGLVGILLCEPLGTTIFGHMDDEWRRYATDTNDYCVPSQWPIKDWFSIVTAFAIVATGRAFSRLAPNARRLLDAVMLLAAVGLAVSVVAPFLPYKLLLQGQAYRALWPLQFLQIPVLFGLLGRFLNGRLSPAGKPMTLIVLLGFAVAKMTGWQIVAALLVLAAVHGLRLAVAEADHTRAARLRRAAVLALSASLILTSVLAVASFSVVFAVEPPLAGVALLPHILGPFFAWVAAACLLVAIRGFLRSGAIYRAVTAGGWLGIQLVFFLLPTSPFYESWGVEEAEDVAFVEDYLVAARPRLARTPVLYWPLGPLDSIWIRLGCDSYYSVSQTAGNMFNRGTAIEGHRRAWLSRAFELSAREKYLHLCTDAQRCSIRRIFGRLTMDPPTQSELFRLCSEKGVDLLILPNRFDGWFAATNGRLFIYDARWIRESLATSSQSRADGPPSLQAETAETAGYAEPPPSLGRISPGEPKR